MIKSLVLGVAIYLSIGIVCEIINEIIYKQQKNRSWLFIFTSSAWALFYFLNL